MFRFAQHDKIPIVIASKAKQSTVYKARIMRIPCLLVAMLALLARNDPPPAPLRKGGGNGGATLVALGARFLFVCAQFRTSKVSICHVER